MNSEIYLMLAAGEQRERQQDAARDARAVQVVRLRRLERRAQRTAARLRLARLAVS